MLLMQQPEQLDPLIASSLSAAELVMLADANDLAASEASLDATLHHWKDAAPLLCRDWITALIESVQPLAVEIGLSHRLKPLMTLLENGNQAMRWQSENTAGRSIADLLHAGSLTMEEQELTDHSCSAALG